MGPEPAGRRRYPTWVRIVLVALQATAVLAGLWIGNATYVAWSEPDEPEPPTTSVVRPAEPEPEAPSELE